MIKVVIDTNVVVSALLKSEGNPALILSLVFDEEIRICLSEEIIQEYQGVLKRKKFCSLNQIDVKKFLTKLQDLSLFVNPQERINLLTDPDDNKFLDCAYEAKADYLVTGNKKHFPINKFKNTKIVSPLEFIKKFASTISNNP